MTKEHGSCRMAFLRKSADMVLFIGISLTRRGRGPTACDSSFPLPFHLDNPLIPPIHLNNTVRRYGTLERMTIGEGNEEVRRSIRVLGVDVFECREITVVVVVVRDKLLVS
jgi:hypothetical protein